jgi:hypothetical protein
MTLVPIDFLLEASPKSLQDLELAALNRSANLSKTLKTELDAWVEQLALAMLARWMIENREVLLRAAVKPKSVDLFEAPKKKSA